MRMSVNKEDPGYENLDYSAAVYLDGVLQRRVETADEEAGYVCRYATDPTGVLIVEGDTLVTEEVFGEVRIVLGGEE